MKFKKAIDELGKFNANQDKRIFELEEKNSFLEKESKKNLASLKEANENLLSLEKQKDETSKNNPEKNSISLRKLSSVRNLDLSELRSISYTQHKEKRLFSDEKYTQMKIKIDEIHVYNKGAVLKYSVCNIDDHYSSDVNITAWYSDGRDSVSWPTFPPSGSSISDPEKFKNDTYTRHVEGEMIKIAGNKTLYDIRNYGWNLAPGECKYLKHLTVLENTDVFFSKKATLSFQASYVEKPLKVNLQFPPRKPIDPIDRPPLDEHPPLPSDQRNLQTEP